MARTVKKTGSSKIKVTESKPQNFNVLPGGKLNNLLNSSFDKFAQFKTSKAFYLIILAMGIALLFFFKKSWFIAAMINGAPVTNLELQSKLNQQFKAPILNQLIEEKIIMLEANKLGAVPSEQEIDSKIAEAETSVGGKEVLDSLLSQQGQTRSSFKDQMRVRLAITKMYEKEATVSGEEIAKFIEENKQSLPSYKDGKEQLRATDSAQQEKEAYDMIKNQKLTQIFSQRFQELRQKAKIQIF